MSTPSRSADAEGRPSGETDREVASEAIFGRERELDELERALERVARGPAGVLLEGEAGIGKTRLLNAGREAARRRSYRVLAARPSETEMQLSFAALADLLEDVLDGVLYELPPPQQRALKVALLLEEPDGTAQETRAVPAAFVTALRAIAQERPVVVAVDDVQWLDEPTATVLEYAARRLRDDRIGLMLAVRSGTDSRVRMALERGLSEGHLHATRPAR